MPAQPDKKLSDAELDQLARELFAQVRAQHPEEPVSKPSGDTTGDAGAALLDWLFDGLDGDAGDGGD